MSVYPQPHEYIASVKALSELVHDEVLKSGQPCETAAGRLWTVPGGFTFVFKIRALGRDYALRCWTQELADAERHYKEIDEFLRGTRLPYFVECKFTASGITVNGNSYPIVRMEWVDHMSLRKFIADQITSGKLDDPQRRASIKENMEKLAESFVYMCASLHREGIAHGDLQADNIKVIYNAQRFDFKLIDYDTLCLPKGRGRRLTNAGLPAYQHPLRAQSVATEKGDFFSELVIYLSLRAIAQVPELWKEFDCESREKHLLFEGVDFQAAAGSQPPTPIFRRLYGINHSVRDLAVVLWNFARCPDCTLLMPVEGVATMVGISQNPRNFGELFKSGHTLSMAATVGSNEWMNDRAFLQSMASEAATKSNNGAQKRETEIQAQLPQSPPRPLGFNQLLDNLRHGVKPMPASSPVAQPQSLSPPPAPTRIPVPSQSIMKWQRMRARLVGFRNWIVKAQFLILWVVIIPLIFILLRGCSSS